MKTRRTFLEMLLVTGFVSRLVPGTRWTSAGSPGFHLVNGWILTDHDVAEIRKYES